MSPFLAELLGTAILMLLGQGVNSNTLLSGTKGSGGGFLMINVGWGMSVFVAVFCVAGISGAHINPAVTVGLAAGGEFPWGEVPGYLLAQMVGAMLGSALAYAFYHQHFRVTEDPSTKLGVFCTAPAIRGWASNLFCEALGTFMLVLPIFLMSDPQISLGGVVEPNGAGRAPELGLGALGALPVGLLVFCIGMALGGTTGYAINPARDLGPRLVHAVLPIPGKGGSDWSYAWIPVVGPLIGGLAAGLLALGLT